MGDEPEPGSLAQLFEEQVAEILHIRESSSLPSEAWIAVRHRGHWFYIDDRDLPSKRAFTLAAELLNLEVSNSDSGQTSPILTLPLG